MPAVDACTPHELYQYFPLVGVYVNTLVESVGLAEVHYWPGWMDYVGLDAGAGDSWTSSEGTAVSAAFSVGGGAPNVQAGVAFNLLSFNDTKTLTNIGAPLPGVSVNDTWWADTFKAPFDFDQQDYTNCQFYLFGSTGYDDINHPPLNCYHWFRYERNSDDFSDCRYMLNKPPYGGLWFRRRELLMKHDAWSLQPVLVPPGHPNVGQAMDLRCMGGFTSDEHVACKFAETNDDSSFGGYYTSGGDEVHHGYTRTDGPGDGALLHAYSSPISPTVTDKHENSLCMQAGKSEGTDSGHNFLIWTGDSSHQWSNGDHTLCWYAKMKSDTQHGGCLYGNGKSWSWGSTGYGGDAVKRDEPSGSTFYFCGPGSKSGGVQEVNQTP